MGLIEWRRDVAFQVFAGQHGQLAVFEFFGNLPHTHAHCWCICQETHCCHQKLHAAHLGALFAALEVHPTASEWPRTPPGAVASKSKLKEKPVQKTFGTMRLTGEICCETGVLQGCVDQPATRLLPAECHSCSHKNFDLSWPETEEILSMRLRFVIS